MKLYDQDLLDTLTDGFISIDENFTIVQVNKVQESIAGLSREDQIGNNLIDLYFSTPETKDSPTIGIYQKVFSQNQSISFSEFYAPLSTWFQVEVHPSEGGLYALFKDITNKKIHESLYREKENLHVKYADAMPQMAFISDEKGNITYFNSRHYAYFGLAPNDQIGWKWKSQSMHHPEDLERTIKRWSHSLSTGEDYSIEYRLRRHDGEFRWHLGRAVPIRDRNGKILQWFGTNTDIHENKLREQELRQKTSELEKQEAQYKGIFETANDAFMIFDEDGILVEANPACCNMHGYPYEEMIGLTGTDFVHPGDIGKFVKFVIDVQNGKRFNVSARHVRKNGEPFFIDVVGSPILFGGKKHLLAVVRDVSEKEVALKKERKAKENLKNRENEMRALANSIPQLAWMTDSEGWIHWYNDRWYEYTGTSIEEMEGWGWTKVHHPDHVDKIVEFVKDAWNQEKPWELTFPLRRKDGAFRWFLTRAIPIFDSAGNLTRWFGTNTDIHEEKINAQKLEQTGNELKAAVASRDEFLSLASHELKTPLTTLSLQLEILGMQLSSDTPQDELLETVNMTEQQVSRLDKLVSNLLDITRIRSGAANPVFAPFNLEEFTQGIVKQHSFSLEGSRLEVKLCFEEEIEVLWDRNQIEQVFVNIILNAGKYAAGSELQILCKRDESFLNLEFKDNGPGIAKEKQSLIFEKYIRATSSRKTSGLGLGLFITKQIVEGHGGQISVKSELGKGTSFHVSIPIRPEPV